MDFWTFMDRNEFIWLLGIPALLLIVAMCAGVFKDCHDPATVEKRERLLQDCIRTNRPTDECIKLSKEL